MIQNERRIERWDKPTYPLNEVKKLLSSPKTRWITRSSKAGAFSLGFVSDEEMIDVVTLLNEKTTAAGGNFFKSLCVNEALDKWHDIYKITLTTEENKKIYIKLQIDGKNGVIISFKEDEGWYS